MPCLLHSYAAADAFFPFSDRSARLHDRLDARRPRIKPWSVAEAGQFLADDAARDDHLFAAWMLVLCLGLHRGADRGV